MTVAALPASASLVHLYQFQGNLNDSVGSVALVNNGATVGAGSLTFGANEGPTLNAELGLAGTYSIGLQFSANDTGAWKKVIDFQNLTSDSGQYLYVASLTFVNTYARLGQGDDTVNPNTKIDLVVTRDGSTYSTYLNGVSQYSFTDSGNFGVAQNAVFNFFRDDVVSHQVEATGGTLYQLRVWNTALTQTEVNTAFAPVPEPSTVCAAALLAIPAGISALRAWRKNRMSA